MGSSDAGDVRSASAPSPSRGRLDVLREPATIRARCAAITAAVSEGRSGWFRVDRDRLDETAERVEAIMRRRFPDLRIPTHSRWRHFEAGGVDRKAELDARLARHAPIDRARAMFDLTVVSVLLDAGAGSAWRYTEATGGLASAALPAAHHSRDDLMAELDRAAGHAANDHAPATIEGSSHDGGSPRSYARSEGLGVASFRAFMAGAFSSHTGDPLRVDAAALRQIDVAALRAIFQAGPNNPLVGLDGRAGLLVRLGLALKAEATRSALEARPALMFDRLTDAGARTEVGAGELLQELLRTLTPIWSHGATVMGVPAGDVWPHRWAGAATASGEDPTTRGYVPFHKLTQWLAYSLIEPLRWSGIEVTGLEALTGLPEYRNGGLLIDSGVIVPRNPRDLERRFKPGDELIVEWRALTVTLIDELADRVRQRLGVTAEALPLACILEGGTWAAGREIAAERRDGAPPIAIDSDGTVF